MDAGRPDVGSVPEFRTSGRCRVHRERSREAGRRRRDGELRKPLPLKDGTYRWLNWKAAKNHTEIDLRNGPRCDG